VSTCSRSGIGGQRIYERADHGEDETIGGGSYDELYGMEIRGTRTNTLMTKCWIFWCAISWRKWQ